MFLRAVKNIEIQVDGTNGVNAILVSLKWQ